MFRPLASIAMPKKRLIAVALVGTALSAGIAVPASAAVICNRFCDGRSAALAPADRQPLPVATVWGRRIILHLNDTDAMGWASIDSGDPADRVWIDRSFDGGRTWAANANLGDTTIPSGQRSTRTLMYNNDDWAGRGVGALRACGKAGNRPEVACTTWARTTWNAGERRTAAATGLMMFYNQSNGLFRTTGWWNSANALTAVIDNIRLTGMTSYSYAISTTFSRHGSFNNEYLDDTGWWAMAWIGAYDLTGETRYLDMARSGAAHMFAYWDNVCGGGIWWRTDRTYKAAIANTLYLQVNAALHNRIPGDTVYLQRAQASWAWIQQTGMINGSNLVNDGISLNTCRNNNGTVWSYNQGVPLAGLVELNRATGDASLLTRARAMANASSTTSSLHSSGILRDPCEGGSCGADGTSFKGIYVRDLAVLNNALPDRPYTTYLRRQADRAYVADRTPLDHYGMRWNGPVDTTDAARQQSALDLMNAAS